MSTLTRAQARRIAVRAQGFGRPALRAPVTRAHLRQLVARIQLLQLDSVSVAVRAHYAPVFSRLGPYDRALLDRAAWGPGPRMLVEYWAHEAALIAVEDWPLLRWRMRRYPHGRWGRDVVRANPGLAEAVLAAVTELGPATAGQIEAHVVGGGRAPARAGGSWGNRSATKWVAEALFSAGRLTTATRVGFARHYDLVENVLPGEVVARDVEEPDAIRTLVRRSAAALGVATAADLRDYFRLSAAQTKPAIAALVADGALEPVTVEDWPDTAYLIAGQRVPRRDVGAALLCPFDPLIFCRPRVARLFDFDYRLEIYTPAPRRRYGYYVWPFLLDGELVGRVDLKADRARGVLQVIGAFGEPGRDRSRVAAALAGELGAMASWLGLDDVAVGSRGDLVGVLRKALDGV